MSYGGGGGGEEEVALRRNLDDKTLNTGRIEDGSVRIFKWPWHSQIALEGAWNDEAVQPGVLLSH